MCSSDLKCKNTKKIFDLLAWSRHVDFISWKKNFWIFFGDDGGGDGDDDGDDDTIITSIFDFLAWSRHVDFISWKQNFGFWIFLGDDDGDDGDDDDDDGDDHHHHWKKILVGKVLKMTPQVTWVRGYYQNDQIFQFSPQGKIRQCIARLSRRTDK